MNHIEDNWRSDGNKGDERRSFEDDDSDPCWGCLEDLY